MGKHKKLKAKVEELEQRIEAMELEEVNVTVISEAVIEIITEDIAESVLSYQTDKEQINEAMKDMREEAGKASGKTNSTSFFTDSIDMILKKARKHSERELLLPCKAKLLEKEGIYEEYFFGKQVVNALAKGELVFRD